MADETPETDDTPAADAGELDADPVEETASAPSETGSEADTAAESPKGDDDAAPAKPTVVRKKVTSKRVTPKGSPQGVKAGSTAARTKAKASESDDGDDEPTFSKRYTPPQATYAPGPSPWWVPALMFGLLIIGALVIMLNYMGVFGDAENLRLVIGLAFILGGIITATQYR